MKESDMLPVGCVKSMDLIGLAKALSKMHTWHKRHGGRVRDEPCLRLIQGSRNGRVTALIQTGDITLKLVLKDGDWIVVGDALKAPE